MTAVTVKKYLISILLILGAVAGATAPFVHILYPKTAPEKIQLEKDFEESKMSLAVYKVKKAELKEKYRFVGFTNKRRFMYAIGLPVSLFVISIFGLISVKYINKKLVKLSFSISSTASMFTAVYFMAWTFWAYKTGSDFPRWAYYISLILISITVTVSTRMIINGWYRELLKLKSGIIEFLVEVKEVHYTRILLRVLGNNTYYEAQQTEIKQDVEEFDNRIREKGKEVAGEDF